MNINEFVIQFKEQFVDAEELIVSNSSKFRDIESWDSLTGMAILMMIQDTYKVEIDEAELKNCSTIQDVFNIVIEKRK